MKRLTPPLAPLPLAFLSLSLALMSCARAPLTSTENAMRRVDPPVLSDDLALEPLLSAIQSEIDYLAKSHQNRVFVFGDRKLTQAEYLNGLSRFLSLARSPSAPSSTSGDFFQKIREEFDFYEVYGQKEWGDVFITSYFEPVIEGSLTPTQRFSRPLYRSPSDLITLDLSAFNDKFKNERQYRGRISGEFLVPYYTREQIDSGEALKNKGLELCWVDPLDAYFLQIQGSGTIDLGDGKFLHLNYDNKNGQAYEHLAKTLKGLIPAEQMNMHTIEAYLRKLPPQEMQNYLNTNPSYVFFKVSDQRALTFIGVPATDGRTIATDPRFFPKGALAFLEFDKPVFANPPGFQPLATEHTSRFVLDQDTGGAITGGGRLDLFWGRGPAAQLYAGAMKNRGHLYYLVPRTDAP